MGALLKKTLLIVVAIVALFCAALFAWAAALKIKEIYWFDPPSSIDGIYIGMTRDDLFFETKNFWECAPKDVDVQDCNTLKWMDEWSYEKNNGVFESNGRVVLEDNIVVRIYQRFNLNKYLFSFYNVEELVVQLGDPDILSISKNLNSRTYTYLDEEWIFSFSQNQLREFVWGKASVRDTVSTPVFGRKPLSSYSDEELLDIVMPSKEYRGNQYVIEGTKVCPGASCPFVEDEFFEEIHMKLLNPIEILGAVSEEKR